jgi:hypothetical protein
MRRKMRHKTNTNTFVATNTKIYITQIISLKNAHKLEERAFENFHAAKQWGHKQTKNKHTHATAVTREVTYEPEDF